MNKGRVVALALLAVPAILISSSLACPSSRAYRGRSTQTTQTSARQSGGEHSAGCRSGRPLRLHFYDVGQASSALVELPDDRVILVDAGGDRTALATKLKPDLRGRPLSMVWITHPHDDHLNQLKAIFLHVRVETYVDNGFDGGSPSRRTTGGMGLRMREAAAAAGAKVASATDPGFEVPVANTDSTRLTAVAPGTWSASCRNGAANNCSLGLRIDYCESSILFLGDAEETEEDALSLTPATLLVVPHHGSNNSTTRRLLQRTRPRYAVISSGRSSRYCHPAAGTIERLNEVLGGPYNGTAVVSRRGGDCDWYTAPRSARLWITAMDGDITMVTTGDGIFSRN